MKDLSQTEPEKDGKIPREKDGKHLSQLIQSKGNL